MANSKILEPFIKGAEGGLSNNLNDIAAKNPYIPNQTANEQGWINRLNNLIK